MKKLKESCYICPICGDLTTETKILEEVSGGSCGMCYCEFDDRRTLNKYKKINRKLWEELMGFRTNNLRLKRYLHNRIKQKSKRGLS